MSHGALDWRPSAKLAALRDRARVQQHVRDFFAARDVLEVETPVLVSHTVTDPHTDSLRAGSEGKTWWLRTSPEYHMKRLLAEQHQDIFQLGKVFRADESGRRHMPEFTMLEWYRIGYGLDDLINETCELLGELLPDIDTAVERFSYRDIFQQHTGLDPLAADDKMLAAAAQRLVPGLEPDVTHDRQTCLDILSAAVIQPHCAAKRLTVITDYPADQAMLANLNPANPETALRFEILLAGVELANGYNELTNADEQERRFAADNNRRAQTGKQELDADDRLLDALRAGLPACSGVAVGIDRVLMLRQNASGLSAVVSFPPGY